MEDLPSVTLVRKHPDGDFYDYVGRVEVVRGPDESVRYVHILDRHTGERLCRLSGGYQYEFVARDGKVVKFRGKIDNFHHGLVIPHIKR